MLVFHSVSLLTEEDLPALIAFAETEAVTQNVCKEYSITRLLNEENILARLCAERVTPGESLKALALQDLNELLKGLTESPLPADYRPSTRRTLSSASYQASLTALVEADTAEALWEGLVNHYRRFGYGDMAKYVAYKWEKGLIGIDKPDHASLDRLFCLDWQKE